MIPNTYIGKNEKINFFDKEWHVLWNFFFLVDFLVSKLTNEKKNFGLAMFYQKISLNVTFDFRDPYRTLKAVKQKKSDQIL